ncbi:NUMOD1 domain-containing DNA-binding protein [Psychroflexus salis]|uniref:GIY-YIG domain-containing protein n=1 Tax=Psychroflexus salis TaxID=1526574 RepID=A0A916ZVW6_9FLAO|nr:NUMOD1 domain-containing DNA-binding protein [Psychroflexus salis]GGE14014.1 hypothetical protein GCM10010831_14220 [Psychroflexus salis]
MRKFKIYKTTNKFTNESYIGATTYSVEQRKLDHTERANRNEDGKFYEAIATYGEDAFEWETIDTASSVDELARKESKYILEYNCVENGYNSDRGGGIKKSVYQYNIKTGELVSQFKSLEAAAASVGLTKNAISNACLGYANTAGDFYWSYDLYEVLQREDSRKKKIIQLTLDGYGVEIFESIAEASRSTGINKSCIAKVCRNERKSAGGYKWIFK